MKTFTQAQSYRRFLGVLVLLLIFMSGKSYSVDCNGVSNWNSAKTYWADSIVQYNGNKYRARFYSVNKNPELYSDESNYEEWILLGTCSETGASVSISSPSNGAAFNEGDNITINALVSNHSSVQVEFFNGTTSLGTDTSSPFSYTISNAAAGSYSLIAKSTDGSSNVYTSTTVSITVNSSSSGNCSGLAFYSAGTTYDQDEEVVNNVGGQDKKYKCKVPGWCSHTSAAHYEPGNGSHWTEAWDYMADCSSGGEGENQAPSVSLTAPSNGSTYITGDIVTISANATDSDGTISQVEFFAGSTSLGVDNTSPYSINWTSTAGSYDLKAVATDNDNESMPSSIVSITVNTSGDGGGNSDKLIIGYWEDYSTFQLDQIPSEYDIINIAFAKSSSSNRASMSFDASATSAYTNKQDFIDDVKALQNAGKKVIISIGGQNLPVYVQSAANADTFKNTMIGIIDEYGFDGIDIDLEGDSFELIAGDEDFTNPTSPKIVYFIQGLQGIMNNYNADFMLTMAPETYYVQRGKDNYNGGSNAGAYLPVIYAFRNDLDHLQVQHYNTGSMNGLDGQVYFNGPNSTEVQRSDFHVAMAEMLLAGFSVEGNTERFPALNENQVVIGLPASSAAAGSGYTTPAAVHDAVEYLVEGTSFGGNYTLQNSAGYPDFRGLMTWSIRHDKNNNYEFINEHRPFLDNLGSSSSPRMAVAPEVQPVEEVRALIGSPNPFKVYANFKFQTQLEGHAEITVYDNMGRKVDVLLDKMVKAGEHSVTWEAAGASSGIYFIRLMADGEIQNFKIVKE